MNIWTEYLKAHPQILDSFRTDLPLYTAAPDLLAAARSLLEWSNHHLPGCPLCGALGPDSNHDVGCPVEVAAAAIAKAKGLS